MPTLASTQSAPPKEHVFFVEPLEKRILLSGNVMAAFLGGSLFVDGDELDNDLDLQIVENDIVLVGNQGTTINGSSDVFVVATDSHVIPEKLVAKLNAGNDRFAIGPEISIQKSLIVFAGEGDDSIGVDGTTIKSRLVIIGSGGDDSIAIRNSQATRTFVSSGQGNDVISLNGTEIQRTLHVTTAGGDDHIVIQDSNIEGKVILRGGAGDDNLVIQNSEIDGNLIANGGSGDDFIDLNGVTVHGKTHLVSNRGDDVTLIEDNSRFDRLAFAGGGLGDDQISIDSSVAFSSQQALISFESQSVAAEIIDRRLLDVDTGALSKATTAQSVFEDPTLTLALDVSDNQTIESNGIAVVTSANYSIQGTTLPGALVEVDRDGNGLFDDGTIAAEASGAFEIIVPLISNPTNLGVNDLLVRTTDTLGRQVIESTSIHFAIGTLIRFNSTLGAFDIELLDDEAPITVANFFNYLDSYDNSIVHRSPSVQFVQGGGFLFENESIQSVVSQTPIINEFNATNGNVRGTLSMALVPNSPNSGTSQWFFNTADNSASLDANLHTVFGRVIGSGATILDAIDNIPDYDVSSLLENGALASTPLRNYQPTSALSGTLSIDSGSTTLTGINTLFTTELQANQTIQLGSLAVVVHSITSDTELAVTVASAPASTVVDAAGLRLNKPTIQNYIFLDIEKLT